MNNLINKLTNITHPLSEIAEKVLNNERLTKEDGISLYESFDILSIGVLADYARIKRLDNHEKKDFVYWINNHHLNLTNICEGSCKFCAYKRKEGQEGAFLYSLEKAVEYLETKVSKNAGEIHIVSALNPSWTLENYKTLLKESKRILPDTHIQAFTAVEIDYLAKISNISTKQVLQELIDSGLGSLPGGGAEIFAENIRQKVCPEKISGDKWLEIMETAHQLGLKSNATMLTGIGETVEDKIDHMLKIREVQDRTGGFMTFIPLFCHYENTEIIEFQQQTGFETVKDYAVSRLMLDNVPHIKAFWIQIGTKLAQITLSFGVDDLDGTVMEEKITRYAGAKTGHAMSKDELIHLIKRAGKTPVERDTVYNIVKVY
ncbi:MAG: aminofutalosine synthase MqnE [bacterium]